MEEGESKKGRIEEPKIGMKERRKKADRKNEKWKKRFDAEDQGTE